MFPQLDSILATPSAETITGIALGQSREGRDVVGHRIGTGRQKISLIAGCHADEPAGPRFLNYLVQYLGNLPADSALRTHYQWWIVPHVNPDGAERNRAWSDGIEHTFDVVTYLKHVVRELPGDDIEFGFPRDESDTGARPENRALYDWWRSDPAPFTLHASLHGMAFAGGPWFLVDPAWVDRCDHVMACCHETTGALGYRLHDIERRGEKGFHRIDRGFCTRPNSKAMSQFFEDKGDTATAALFRPSSMETIRAHGGDPLTLVSEMPLFVLPGVGEQIEPGDPVAEVWRMRIEGFKKALAGPHADTAENPLDGHAIQPVPITDQMRLQWTFITAGIEQVVTENNASSAL